MRKTVFLFMMFFIYPLYGYVVDNVTNGCGSYIIRATFLAYQYDCAAGYFLPANTLGCQPCPTGYTCPGGTFDFNTDLAQGIKAVQGITQNSPNMCSTDYRYFIATWEDAPTINVTYDYGDGNTETTTCFYNDELTIPPAPAPRVGYTFTGWKVVNNND